MAGAVVQEFCGRIWQVWTCTIQTTGGASGLEPTTAFLIDLAKEFPHLGYIKEEWSPVIPRMIELASHRSAVKSVFSGNGGRGMMYEWRLGMDGTMPGSPYSDLYVQVWDAFQAGDKDKAREIFSKLLLMLNCETQVEGTGASRKPTLPPGMSDRKQLIEGSLQAVPEGKVDAKPVNTKPSNWLTESCQSSSLRADV